jgi:DMSO/TMAO reductase YedYZ heme-binding membrane subunit
MSTSTHFWWYCSRAAGLTAWACAGLAILLGILLGTRLLGKRPGAPYLTALHRHLAFLTLAATIGHLAALVADSYTHFTLQDFLVPGASAWRPLPVALGVVALYLLVAVQASSYAMRRLPRRIWHLIHLGSYLCFALICVHAFTAGSDLASPLVRLGTGAAIAGLVFFSAYRVLGPSRAELMAELRERAKADQAG